MRSILFLLAFISSVFAYSITSPNSNQGWTNQGAQLLTWTRVNTDRLNFTVVLTNQNITGFQPVVLATSVDGTLGSAPMNTPSGGWPSPGGSFRVNLVQDANNLDAILAQSNQFNITQGTSTISSSSTKGSTTRSASSATGSTTGSATGSADSSSTQTSTSKSNNAVKSEFTMSSLLAFISMMGFVLS
ncbi:uncharacterized protein LACBIDRAFT_307632 [Laccaria bicolor S238N-H82]|uniref:Predicted protein n=1 Tax=Laccaria bicolor (strain S238N-H82 / ATCC MYA-4686) TaxID=486041 RepID=B0DQM1_LACBS|nr:uncharacterized protein LACBIDRAFT_307632 [Laccaria bicolor S238N-H82]EDR03054.1 predicted protein [Laccaria bicolor S238N-H82]|eukprot:XP_001886195.1 predicted protein [Laccaria bicolor S238N-H82]